MTSDCLDNWIHHFGQQAQPNGKERRKKNAFLRQALELHDLKTFKDMVLRHRLFWQQK